MYKDKSTKEIHDRRELLKIKAKTFAFEIGTIKLEEQRQRRYLSRLDRAQAFGPLEGEMRDHRLGLRRMARETHIAYGLVKGRSYESLEAFSYMPPNWEAVLKMCQKYGDKTTNWKEVVDAANRVQIKQVLPAPKPRVARKPYMREALAA